MSADFIQANTYGRLHDATEPSISPLNRGFLYGDAIYEVWRTYGGVIFAWDEHWQRLERSAQSLHLALPFTQAECLEQVRRTAKAFAEKTGAQPELYIRLQISRGAGAIGLNTLLADRTSYVLLIQPLKVPTAESNLAGLKLSLATSLHRNHPDTLNPAWKTGNYLNNILCLREAIARGADEVVMTNLAGEITESAVSNIFFVRDGVLCTPPLGAGILEGITRAMILTQVAPRVGCRVDEAPIPAASLGEFQECFLSSTTKEISPVRSIDAVNYSVAEGTLSRQLAAAFSAYAGECVAARLKLRVW